MVNVVTCKEANVMLNVKATKSLPAQFDIVTLLKHQTSIFKAVARPLFKCCSIENIFFQLMKSYFVLNMLAVVFSSVNVVAMLHPMLYCILNCVHILIETLGD